MKVNRQHFLAFLEQGYPVSQLIDRATGRSTALALKLVVAAIENPGKELTVEDHHPTRYSHESVLKKAREIAHFLGLHGWEWNSANLTVVNNITEEVVLAPESGAVGVKCPGMGCRCEVASPTCRRFPKR